MNKYEIEVFSFLSSDIAAPFMLDVVSEPRRKLGTRTLLVSLGFSLIVNAGLVLFFSKNSDFIFGFYKDYNKKSVALSLNLTAKMIEVVAQKINVPENNYNQPTLLNEITDPVSKKKKVALAIVPFRKPSKPKVDSSKEEHAESGEVSIIFDPRIQAKLKNNYAVSRSSKAASIYLNNYSSIDGSDYTSFGDKCFNVRSLDNGIRNRKIWISKCRGVKTVSETMLDNVNRSIREKFNR